MLDPYGIVEVRISVNFSEETSMSINELYFTEVLIARLNIYGRKRIFLFVKIATLPSSIPFLGAKNLWLLLITNFDSNCCNDTAVVLWSLAFSPEELNLLHLYLIDFCWSFTYQRVQWRDRKRSRVFCQCKCVSRIVNVFPFEMWFWKYHGVFSGGVYHRFICHGSTCLRSGKLVMYG